MRYSILSLIVCLAILSAWLAYPSVVTSRSNASYMSVAADTDFDWDTGAQGYMDPWTVCGWFRLDTLNAENYLLCLNDQENGRAALMIEAFSTGRLEVGVSDGTFNYWLYSDFPDGGISAGQWFHVAVTCSEGYDLGGAYKNDLIVYFDGASKRLDQDRDWAIDFAPIMGEPSFWMRRGYSVTPHIVDGASADLRLYNVELTADEIQTIYQYRGADKVTRGIVDRWLPIGNGAALSDEVTGQYKRVTWVRYGTSDPTGDVDLLQRTFGPIMMR